MTSDSTGQTPSEGDAAASEHAPGEGGAERREPEQQERYGPLSLLRTRKSDGRALILFSHAGEEHER